MQHEYDHLLGIEFLEKVHDYKQLMDYENYKKYVRGKKEWLKNQEITIKEYKLL